MNRLKRFWRKNNNNKFVMFFLIPLKKVYDFYRFRIMDERKFIEKIFFENHGYKLNLNNPKTLNEKIQWLKLYDRTDLHTNCADKVKVRDIIKEKLGEEYLIPMILQTDNVKDIKEEILPNYPFIIKTNHDSGNYIIVRDKSKVNFEEVRNRFQKALKKNYYYQNKEWQYKNIEPKIIVEKLLMDKNGAIPFDYKFHCIHGKVEMISVDINRGKDNHRRNWYDKDWIRLPFNWSSVVGNNKTVQSLEHDVKKPINLPKMILLSEKISSMFKYVRVDWYEVEGEIFFGELTFHHDSGMKPIEPYEWDLKYGNMLDLS